MATGLVVASLAATLLSAGAQVSAGRTAAKEAELSAQIGETAAAQRETDRKQALASAMATANANAGAAGIAAFEGSPLTILEQSIENEQTATERDAFNTRISGLTARAHGQSAKAQGQLGATTSLLKGGSKTAQLIPE